MLPVFGETESELKSNLVASLSFIVVAKALCCCFILQIPITRHIVFTNDKATDDNSLFCRFFSPFSFHFHSVHLLVHWWVLIFTTLILATKSFVALDCSCSSKCCFWKLDEAIFSVPLYLGHWCFASERFSPCLRTMWPTNGPLVIVMLSGIAFHHDSQTNFAG